MTAKIFARLFQFRDRLTFAGFGCAFTVLAFAAAIPKDYGNPEVTITFFILAPALGLGGLLAEVWNRPVQCRVTALLPALKTRLFWWFCGALVLTAAAWALVMRWVEPAIPYAAALGLSIGLASVPLLTVCKPSSHARLLGWSLALGALLLGFVVSFGSVQRWGTRFMSHVLVFGATGWALAALNLSLVWKRSTRASLAMVTATQALPKWIIAIARALPRRRAVHVSRATWNYPPRRTSLFRWVQAAFQETRGPLWVFVAVYVAILLILPWPMRHGLQGNSIPAAAAFPAAWYYAIFAPDPDGSGIGLVRVLTTTMVFCSFGAPLLQLGRFYPVSRRRRIWIAFTASAALFGAVFLLFAGGTLTLACIVGISLDLPLPEQRAAEFLVRMAADLPFMPMLLGPAINLGRNQNQPGNTFLAPCVMVLLLVAQSYLLDAGLRVATTACLGAIVVSQLLYFAALRRFYTKADLAPSALAQPT
jgi:hypothetical protein